MLMVMEELTKRIRKEGGDKQNKYEYQVNRNKLVGILRDDIIHALAARNQATLVARMNKIIKRAQAFVCPIKPDRTVERLR